MRKILAFVLTLLGVIFITGCKRVDVEALFAETSQTIEAAIPKTINHDFDLPVFNDVDVTYQLGDLTYTDKFEYASPFYDTETEFKYTLKRGNKTQDYSIDVTLLSKESGYNENKLYLSLPMSVTAVTDQDYMQASVLAVTNQNGVNVTDTETDLAKIRGRGNTTWLSYPKKPYKLKFDNNTSLFGMKKAKEYVLLAEYADKSLMRNTIVQKMASLTKSLPYVLETRYVELYVNTVYMGFYVLTEQVEFQKNRLDVESVAGMANTGYLLELDMRLYDQGTPAGWDWFVVADDPYQIREPKTDDPLYTIVNTNYIQDYLQQVDDALVAKSGYESLIDVNAWIDYFIIQELTKNVDVGYSSVYLYKEKDGPLKPGPLWDFDFAIGNADYIDYGPTGFYGMKEYKNRMFMLMMDIPEIRNEYRERFSDFYLDQMDKINTMIDALSLSIEDMANTNFEKWDTLDFYVWPNPDEVVNAHTFLDQVTYVKNYLDERSDWIYQTMYEDDYVNGIFN